MLYVIPMHVVNGAFGGLFFVSLFSAGIANSSKTGFVDGSPYNVRNASKVRLYNDKSKLPQYFRLLLATSIISTVIAFALYGFDPNYIGAAVLWGVLITLPSAYTYWYLIIVKVKGDKR